MLIVITVLLIAAAGAVVYTLRTAAGSSPLTISNRIGRFGLVVPLGDGDRGAAVSDVVTPGRERQQQSAVSQSVERMVGKGRLGTAVGIRLERAGLKMTPGEFISLALAVMMGAMAFGLLFKGFLGLFIGGIIGTAGPVIFLKRRVSKRRKKFIEQLADIGQMMANSMRAGFSIMQSLELISHEAAAPANEEFERVVTEVKLGLPFELALAHLKGRMPSEDVELMIVAIEVQRQIGGNLAEILMIISKTIRERVRFERDLKTLTAQARYSSWIITGLPVAVGIAINLLDPEYESFLYTTMLGNFMIGAAVLMLALGFFFLKRIATIEV